MWRSFTLRVISRPCEGIKHREIRRRDLNKGDLVLRLRQDNRGCHKLSPPWEGPYIVAEVLKPGAYKLANKNGEVFTNPWNIQQLCCFYP